MSAKQPLSVDIELDYYFRPTYEPLHTVHAFTRERLKSGELVLMLRRDTTPNIWGTMPAGGEVGKGWDAAGFEKLHCGPGLELFDLLDECRGVVDYGPELRAYMRVAATTAFADQGKPLWSRWRINEKKLQQAIKRRERAEKAASWFNDQQGADPCAVAKLSPAALLVLANAHTLGARKVWMYRSLARPVLELVRAGYGQVRPEGYFQLANENDALAARAICDDRNLQLVQTKPTHIKVREELYHSNPRRIFSSFKGKPPKLAYPAFY